MRQTAQLLEQAGREILLIYETDCPVVGTGLRRGNSTDL
jgi:hypothetical protein